MRTSVKVKWHGSIFNALLHKDLDKRLGRAANSYKRAVKNSFGTPGTPNIITGQLRDSISAVKISDLEWAIGSDLEYASFLEFGTSKMPAKPFLRPMLYLFGRKILSFFGR